MRHSILNASLSHVSRPSSAAYAKCVEASKRVRWDTDRDVIRGRQLDFGRKFLPDGLSKVHEATYLTDAEKRLLSQIQGRTYANMFCLVERFIGAKTLEVSQDHALGDQTALEALLRLADEELKHQELFRRLETMAAAGMPPGYEFRPRPNDVAYEVLSKSTWTVLALTLDIEIFTQEHYRSSIEPDPELSELWRDVFLFHWREESQHAILEELEWRREDARLGAAARENGVEQLIDLFHAVDGIVQMQANADSRYFLGCLDRRLSAGEESELRDLVLKAYRWQYLVSGAQSPRFAGVLKAMVTPAQLERIEVAMHPLVAGVAGT